MGDMHLYLTLLQSEGNALVDRLNSELKADRTDELNHEKFARFIQTHMYPSLGHTLEQTKAIYQEHLLVDPSCAVCNSTEYAPQKV